MKTILVASLIVLGQATGAASAAPLVVTDALDIIDSITDTVEDLVDSAKRALGGGGGGAATLNQSQINETYAQEINRTDEILHKIADYSSAQSWTVPTELDQYNNITMVVTKDDHNLSTHTVHIEDSNVTVSTGAPTHPDGQVVMEYGALTTSNSVIESVRSGNSTFDDHTGDFIHIYMGTEISENMKTDFMAYFDVNNPVKAVEKALVTGMSVPADTNQTDVTFTNRIGGGDPGLSTPAVPSSGVPLLIFAVLLNIGLGAFALNRI